MISDWCAKLYKDLRHTGTKFIVEETTGPTDLDDSMRNEISSIIVNDGCQFVGYKEKNGVTPILNAYGLYNHGFIGYVNNDMLQSYSCNCGKY